MAELQVVGQPLVIERLLEQATRAGARPAEAGEFTYRAFRHGKIDLTRAEGVAASIEAINDAQLRAAAQWRHGELGRLAADFVETISDTLAMVEAGIDFTDQEDVVPIGVETLRRRLSDTHEAICRALDQAANWRDEQTLPRIVLVGPPSVGKSTLFNALLGRDRAVVDPTPGVTRDVLVEPVQLQRSGSLQAPSTSPDDSAFGASSPAALRGPETWTAPQTSASGSFDPRPLTVDALLVDLAGLDEPAHALDREIQQQARDAIDGADLALRLEAADGSDTQAARTFGPLAERANAVLRVRTKADLAAEPSPEKGTDPSSDREVGAGASDEPIEVSAVTGEGLDRLRAAIAARLVDVGPTQTGQALVLRSRHRQALEEAADALDQARAALDQYGLGFPEIIAGQLRDALDHLAAVGSETTPDDVVGRVFASFCVGK